MAGPRVVHVQLHLQRAAAPYLDGAQHGPLAALAAVLTRHQAPARGEEAA